MLRAGLRLIRNEKNWTQGVSARGKSGREVQVYGPAACCFCSDGALLRQRCTDPNFPYEAERDARKALATAIGAKRYPDKAIIAFNDNPATSHCDVLSIWNRAITALEAATGSVVR